MNIQAMTEQEQAGFLVADPEAVRQMEDILLQHPQVDLHTEHYLDLVGGMYVRTITIPAGTVLTGALSRVDHLCIVSGDITVTTDEGPKHITGSGILLPVKAGSKRAGIAHANTTWSTVFRTDCQTIEEAEQEFTGEAERLQSRNTQLLEGN